MAPTRCPSRCAARFTSPAFRLWQAANATLHFDDRLWPDYDIVVLAKALAIHSTQKPHLRPLGTKSRALLRP
ncbi:hypothetical protein [Streptomyces sp. NPDC048644]|uniref:hypothetical protein n=1 Tax=Streptomyces sp. NPDC048644 TaxID=3365582 RepID=UPI00371C14B2